jgi:hypothetical protein
LGVRAWFLLFLIFCASFRNLELYPEKMEPYLDIEIVAVTWTTVSKCRGRIRGVIPGIYPQMVHKTLIQKSFPIPKRAATAEARVSCE